MMDSQYTLYINDTEGINEDILLEIEISFIKRVNNLVNNNTLNTTSIHAKKVSIKTVDGLLYYDLELKKLGVVFYVENGKKVIIGCKYSDFKKELQELLDNIIIKYFNFIEYKGKIITDKKLYTAINKLIQDDILNNDSSNFKNRDSMSLIYDIGHNRFHILDPAYYLMKWLENQD